ncbi:MAG: hypothetical protein ACI8RZ_001334 [Myxococcota bacterium]
MIDLTAIFADTPPDSPLQIQAKMAGIWAAVGEGVLARLSPDRFEFSGTLAAIEPGPVSLSLTLSEDGVGRLVLRGMHDDAAAWWPYDDGIVVTATLAGRAGELTLWPGGGGVYLTLAGAVSAQLWLGRP